MITLSLQITLIIYYVNFYFLVIYNMPLQDFKCINNMGLSCPCFSGGLLDVHSKWVLSWIVCS